MNKEELFDEDLKEIKLSQSEVYFEWWLEACKSKGLVLSWERCETFVLRPPLVFDFNQNYKVLDPLIKQVSVLRDIRYTPDYKVVFNAALKGKMFAKVQDGFISEEGRDKSSGNIWQEILFINTDAGNVGEPNTLYFDVKPPSQALKFSGALGSSRDFPIKQRLMYEEYGIFVNKVIPYGQKECLFTKTFLPKRYLWADKSTKLRTLKDYEKKAKNIDQYLEVKNITI